MKIDMGKAKQIIGLNEIQVMKLIEKKYKWDVVGDYFYRSCGSKVLAVAHMDTVLMDTCFKYFNTGGDHILMSHRLDDRLGVFAILELLPQLDISYDILLTTGEESMMSTARDFTTDFIQKEYNWIFELDRAGTDVVLYEYDSNTELIGDLKKAGFTLGTGTFSDICEMEEMGTSAFNIGIGYHLQHTQRCWASMFELMKQLGRLKVFWNKFYDKKYIHVPTPSGYSWRFSSRDDWTYDIDIEDREWAEEVVHGSRTIGTTTKYSSPKQDVLPIGDDTKPYGRNYFKTSKTKKSRSYIPL